MDKAGDGNQHSWRLDDDIDFIEAQFSLGDFCLDHFPQQPQFARAIQNADTVADLRNELKPVLTLIYGERKELTDGFTSLIFRLNSTKH